jgi:Raf kinase inhibitor-like YbhB/YbcL family protein
MTSIAYASVLVGVGVGLGLGLAACSSDSPKATGDGGTQDATAGSMTLTSTAFAEGGTIPTDNSCKGANTSPVLAWTGAPSGTQGFAVVLTDQTISMAHWVIYDVSASATGLPAAIENNASPASVPGAHQIDSIHSGTIGYYGPCPPSAHTYQFTVYALDVATLPGVSASSSRPEAVAAIQPHRLASGTLTGNFAP